MGQMMGYARVSTPDQDVSLQRDALQQAGCREEHVFLDIASGARTARPGLAACLQALAPGDTLVVWRLDRLGRSMVHLVAVIEALRGRQVGFRSLGDGAIDTTTASGELVFHLPARQSDAHLAIGEKVDVHWPRERERILES